MMGAILALALVGGWLVAGPARLPLHRLRHGVRPGVTLAGAPMGGMYRSQVEAALQAWWRQTYQPAIDAGIDRATGQIIPERDGLQLNVGQTLALVMRARVGARLAPVYERVPAAWTAADLRRMTHVAGQYTTWAYGSPERVFNIGHALRALNNSLVYPGQTFSFMAQMPPFTAAGGWKNAKVILDGEAGQGIGGGVCQVSSTLYNAVRRAQLQIVERHAHAIPVPYVPRGCDATVAAYPLLDFQFRNTLSAPVRIAAALERGAVRIRIYTLPPAG